MTDYQFDKLGLVERVVQPGDSLAYPTLWYQYNRHIYREQVASGEPIPSPPYVTVWQRERPPEGMTVPTTAYRESPGNPVSEPDAYVSRIFFDGLGRIIQTRSEEADGKVLVSGWTEYNAKGKPKYQYLPFFSTGFDYVDKQKPPADTGETDTKAELYYAPLEHLVRTVNPNKTYSEVKYQPWWSVSYDEEDVEPTSDHYDTPKEMAYDAYGRLIQVIEYASKAKEPITTQYRYDLNDNLIEIMDAKANQRHFVYDLLGRQLYQFEPNTGTRIYFYDQNGNLIYRRDNKGQWIKFEYDALNRLTKKHYLKDDGPQLVVSNIYDDGDGENLIGRLAKVEDLSGNTEFSYDARGRILGKTRRLSDLDRDFVTEYQYDSMNRVWQVTYPDAKRTIVTYDYDEGNHLERIPGYVDEMTYNAKGQRESIQYANGVCTEYTYEPLTFRLNSLKTTSNGGADGDLQHLVYDYDNVGNILYIEDISPHAGQQEYDYDSRYRLTHAQRTGAPDYNITYGYDDIDNITQKSNLAPDTFDYDLDGRPNTLDRYGDITLSYDDNGNLQQTPEMMLHWDFEDRLENIEKTDATMATYVYDAAGIRTVKQVQRGDEANVVYYVDQALEIRSGKEMLYIFDGVNRIARVDEAGEITYFHGDHLGSTAFLSDSTGQLLGERFIYSPYGQMIHGSSRTEYGFTGKELDDESGLNYYDARYYHSILAHFITPDPLYLAMSEAAIGRPAKSNLYAYTLGNPLKYVDTTGTDDSSPELMETPFRVKYAHEGETRVEDKMVYTLVGKHYEYVNDPTVYLNKSDMRKTILYYLPKGETLTSFEEQLLEGELSSNGVFIGVRSFRIILDKGVGTVGYAVQVGRYDIDFYTRYGEDVGGINTEPGLESEDPLAWVAIGKGVAMAAGKRLAGRLIGGEFAAAGSGGAAGGGGGKRKRKQLQT